MVHIEEHSPKSGTTLKDTGILVHNGEYISGTPTLRTSVDRLFHRSEKPIHPHIQLIKDKDKVRLKGLMLYPFFFASDRKTKSASDVTE